jgi:hypothetical protein
MINLLMAIPALSTSLIGAANFVSLLPNLIALTPRLYYAAPLVVVISLVYGATRHETLSEIVGHAFRSIVWVVGFMAIILGVIWAAGFLM